MNPDDHVGWRVRTWHCFLVRKSTLFTGDNGEEQALKTDTFLRSLGLSNFLILSLIFCLPDTKRSSETYPRILLGIFQELGRSRKGSWSSHSCISRCCQIS